MSIRRKVLASDPRRPSTAGNWCELQALIEDYTAKAALAGLRPNARLVSN